MRYTIALLFFTALTAAAQPVISPGGITSGANPFGSIAAGSIFFVYGTGLGADNASPMSLFQTTTYPLPSSGGLNGTTIQFVPLGGQGPAVANQGTVYGIMLYESPTMLAAILPSSTQIASYNITVTYNGQTSKPSPILRIVQRAFNLFTYAQISGGAGIGYGPGVIYRQDASGNFGPGNLRASATPGSPILLVGTGLGAAQGDDSKGPQGGVTGLSALDLQVYIGNQPATIVGAARISTVGANFAGVDVIEANVPQNVQGCYVPVTVITDGVTSNFITISVDPGGASCSDSLIGYSQDDLQLIHDDQIARIGTVSLIGGQLSGVAPDGTPVTARNDSVTTTFANLSPAQLYGGPGLPSAGGCMVLPLSPNEPALAQAASQMSAGGTPMDAGPVLNLNGTDGYLAINQTAGKITYGALSGNTAAMIDAGGYNLDNGDGGADVGSFQGSVNLPAGPQVTGGVGSVVSTKQNLVMQWTGGDPNSLILITGLSADTNTGYSVVFECTAPPTAQQFTVPSYVLGWLPTTGSSVGFLAVQNLGQTRFQAPGLEAGYLTYQVGDAIQVQYSSGPGVKQ